MRPANEPPTHAPKPMLGPLKGEQYATILGYTDSHPYEVVARTAKTLTLRKMKAEKDPTWKGDFIPGGFAAHCANQNEQRWFLQSDPEGSVVRAHLRKDGAFHTAYGSVRIGSTTTISEGDEASPMELGMIVKKVG